MKYVSSGGGEGGEVVSGLDTAEGGTALADNALVRGDGTTGIQGTSVTLSDTTGAFVQLTVDGGFTFTVNGAGTIGLAGPVRIPDGTMAAPALALSTAPTGPGAGKTTGGTFGLIHSSTVYTDLRGNALAVRSSATGGQGGIHSDAPSATVPNMCPDVISDADTGHGRAGADKLSSIAGGNEIVRAEFSGAAKKIGFLGKTTAPAAAQTGGAATASVAYTATEQAMLQAAYDCLRTFGLLT